MKRIDIVRALSLVGALMGLIAIGCHADANDPAGQANELSDSVRRENAVANLQRLYSTALADAGGDRAAAGPRAIADASITQLTSTYVDHPEDVSNGEHILDLLAEMRDVRSLPALTKALDWRAEVTEEHAIRAATALQNITLDDAQRGQAIEAIGSALDRVSQARGVDNRMRIQFLRALGSFHDPRATAAVTRVLERQSEHQDFLINRLAAEQLGQIADPASVPQLIRALYMFAPNNPAMRMNDVAAQALVRIGRPALQPLLDTLAGRNTEANQIATAYIAAIRQRDAQAAAQMSAEAVISNEAAYALGQLGFREAIDPLIAEATQLDEGERADAEEEDAIDQQRILGAGIALVSINRTDADTPRIREALLTVFRRGSLPAKMQILVGMQHFGDPGLLPFLLERARRPAREADEIPDMRVLAFRAYAMLANGAEMAALQQVLTTEPEGICRDEFVEMQPAITAATECGEDLACWQRKLTDTDVLVVRKSTYMLARYGRGNAEVMGALVAQLGHANEEVRGEVLYALDFGATSGSPEAVARIDALAEAEQGRQIWEHVEPLARAVQARLTTRTGQ